MTPSEHAIAGQAVAADLAAGAREAKSDLLSLIEAMTSQEAIAGFVYLARLQLDWIAAHREVSVDTIASQVTTRLADSLSEPRNAPFLTLGLVADVATAIRKIAEAKPQTLSDGFDGDVTRASTAYRFVVFTLGLELGEEWAVEDEVVYQRLALQCAKESGAY